VSPKENEAKYFNDVLYGILVEELQVLPSSLTVLPSRPTVLPLVKDEIAHPHNADKQGSVSAWEVGFVLNRLGNLLNSDETELYVV
jgi:hypothetical protein